MTSPAQNGYLDLLRRHPDFRRLYLAHTLSLVGDWFNLIAVLLVLTELTGSSALSVSWLLILKLFPVFFVGPVAGVVADRFPRKTIMIVTDLIRCVIVLSILLVSVYPAVWILYVAVALQISVSAFFEPARTATVPNLVPAEDLTAANALGAVTWSAMFTLGAALGGVVTDRLGWEAAILVDAASYIVSVFLLLRVRIPHRRVRPREGRSLGLYEMSGAKDVVEGARYILRHGEVGALILVKTIWGMGAAITLVLTIMGSGEYALGGSAALGIAVLYTARALGTGLGPIISRRITQSIPRRMWRILGWSYFWGAVWYLGFTAAHNLWLGALCITIAHIGGSTIWVFSTVLLQQTVPDHFRGRVFAAELGVFTLTASVSYFVFGWLMDAGGLSPRAAVGLMCLGLLVPASFWIRANRDRE